MSNADGVIKYFTILGERCSGTNLLHHLLESNFELEYLDIFHHKHFFGFCKESVYKERSKDTLFVCIARNVYEWIASLFEKQHHMAKTNSLRDFMTREIRSWSEDSGEEIIEDRNYETNEPYTSIFALRRSKILFCRDILPRYVAYHHFVLYENISSSPLQINFLEKISQQFSLVKKTASFRSVAFNAQIFNHTQQKKVHHPRKYFIKDPADLEFIDNNTDVAVEKSIGYDMRFFRHKVDISKRVEISQPQMQMDMIRNRNKSLLDKNVLSKMTLDEDDAKEADQKKTVLGSASPPPPPSPPLPSPPPPTRSRPLAPQSVGSFVFRSETGSPHGAPQDVFGKAEKQMGRRGMLIKQTKTTSSAPAPRDGNVTRKLLATAAESRAKSSNHRVSA